MAVECNAIKEGDYHPVAARHPSKEGNTRYGVSTMRGMKITVDIS